MTLLSIVTACALAIGLDAGADPAPALASPGTEITSAMVEAYRSVGSYHARWILESDEADPASSRSTIEIALDRESGCLLIRRQVLRHDGREWWPTNVGEIVAFDGRTVRAASRADETLPWREETFEPTEDVSYWMLRRLLAFEPIDLPLLLGEHPIAGWLHSSAGAVEVLADAGAAPAVGLRFSGAGKGPSITAWLDETSLLIRAATHECTDHRYTLETLAVDEPLSPSLFDLEVQLAVVDPKVFY